MQPITAHATADPYIDKQSDAFTVCCYENEIPTFIETEIDRLYENVYSSLDKLRIYGGLHRVNTYIVRRAGKPVTILIYRIDGSTVRVLNELIVLATEEIDRFAATIFTSHSAVAAIVFRAIRPRVRRSAYRFQLFNHAEDIVVPLPDTIDEYLSRLGKSTRRTIRSYTNKLMRRSPSFRYQWYEKEQANEGDVREIIRMNRDRMRVKNRVSDISEEETLRILEMVRAYGLVGVATIDGRICGGTIAYRCGRNYFLAVSAHRSEYDFFRLGTLCSYFAICECIQRGGRECHFLWGQYEYKYSLLGVQRNLDNLTLYRSGRHMLLNADRMVMTAVEGNVRRIKLWMHEGVRRKHRVPRLMQAALTALRNTTRFAVRIFAGGA